jgi:DNA (cytosine-5)-methyltransferase 1
MVDLRASASPPKAIDLFCGAGGLSLGLSRAGFEVIASVDNDPHGLATFETNHPSTRALLADIREIKGRDLTSGAAIDLLAGGPCCQGFSTHGKRWADDPRNFLFVEFVRFVDELRPKLLLMENVKGLLLARRGAFHREILETFRELGYRVEGRVLNAADYGVPQLRHRVFYLGNRLDEPPHFPEPAFFRPDTVGGLLSPYRTVRDAIGDLPRLGDEHLEAPIAYSSEPFTDYQRMMRGDSEHVNHHVARRVSDHAMRIIRQIEPGHGLRSLPLDELPERFRRMRRISTGALRQDCTTLYHRLSWDAPAYTVTCYFRNVSAGPFVHPEDNRALSCQEAARLQSFPDSFEFRGASVPRQIGNAVPPLLAEAVGRAALEGLNRGLAEAA